MLYHVAFWKKGAKSLVRCCVRACAMYLCSYKRDAMMKLKMSNAVSTDVYLSNRNNDKPVDNNVFTGRLPVSAGPQHHHWQQQHQQLLMQDDASDQFFVESGRAA